MGQEVFTLAGHSDEVRSVAFSPNGSDSQRGATDGSGEDLGCLDSDNVSLRYLIARCPSLYPPAAPPNCLEVK